MAEKGNRKTDSERGKTSGNITPQPPETSDKLNRPYEGYDEQRGSLDVQKDYDIDENNLRERRAEYKDVNAKISGDDKPAA